jgi:hypothetical protein
MTPGQLTYDLRRLRAHNIIQRIPTTNRYYVTAKGIRHSLFLTRLTQHVLIPGLAQLAGPDPPAQSRLRTACRAFESAIAGLLGQGGLAA